MQNSPMASPPQKNHLRPLLISLSECPWYSSVRSNGFAFGQSFAITRYPSAAPTSVMPFLSNEKDLWIPWWMGDERGRRLYCWGHVDGWRGLRGLYCRHQSTASLIRMQCTCSIPPFRKIWSQMRLGEMLTRSDRNALKIGIEPRGLYGRRPTW